MHETVINGIKIKREIIPTDKILALVIPHENNEIVELFENTKKYECINCIDKGTYDIYVFCVPPCVTENDLRDNLIFKLDTQSEKKQGQMYHIKLKKHIDADRKLEMIKVYKDTFKVNLRTAKDTIDKLFATGIVKTDELVYDEQDLYRFCAQMRELRVSTEYSIVKDMQNGKD